MKLNFCVDTSINTCTSQSCQLYLFAACVYACMYLENGEVFQDTVHHMFLREFHQAMYEVNHNVAHWRTIDSVHKLVLIKPCILSLNMKKKNQKKPAKNIVKHIYRSCPVYNGTITYTLISSMQK